jgi:hypothetical protein
MNACTFGATITIAGYTIHGTYHGGMYIDMYLGSDRTPFDVINVWNDATNRPTIACTDRAVERAMIKWCEDAGQSLAHDLRNYDEIMEGYYR